MVKQIIIKAKNINGTRGIKEFQNTPNDLIEIKKLADSPLTIEIITFGEVKEAMEKDKGFLISTMYKTKLISVLSRFRIKYKKDYEVEIL